MTAAVPRALRVVLQHRRSRQVVRVTVLINDNLHLLPCGRTRDKRESSRPVSCIGKESYTQRIYLVTHERGVFRASHTVFIQILRGYRCLPFNEMTQEVNDRLKIPFILHGQSVLKKTIPDRRHASGCLIYRYFLG